jgi:hypothetical protein
LSAWILTEGLVAIILKHNNTNNNNPWPVTNYMMQGFPCEFDDHWAGQEIPLSYGIQRYSTVFSKAVIRPYPESVQSSSHLRMILS